MEWAILSISIVIQVVILVAIVGGIAAVLRRGRGGSRPQNHRPRPTCSSIALTAGRKHRQHPVNADTAGRTCRRLPDGHCFAH